MSQKVHTDDWYYDDVERVVRELMHIYRIIDYVDSEREVERLRRKAKEIASNYRHRNDVEYWLRRVQDKANAKIMRLMMRHRQEAKRGSS